MPKKDDKKKDDKKAYKGWRGTIRAAEKHHPEKFTKRACKMTPAERKKSGELCSYAIFTAKKEKGGKPHYEELPSSTKGTPKKKAKYKDEDKKKKMQSEAAQNKNGGRKYSFGEFIKRKEKKKGML